MSCFSSLTVFSLTHTILSELLALGGRRVARSASDEFSFFAIMIHVCLCDCDLCVRFKNQDAIKASWHSSQHVFFYDFFCDRWLAASSTPRFTRCVPQYKYNQ